MVYANHPCGMHPRKPECTSDGITAPYCPPPCCPPVAPMKPMDECNCRKTEPQKRFCAAEGKQPLSKAVVWPRPVKPAPPHHHSGVICQPAPAKPPKPKCESVLLQKIISCERRNIPQLCARLELDGLPECATPPYQLIMVQQSGAQPWWTPMENHGPDTRYHIRVHIPVCCQVRDACGVCYHASAVVEAEVSFRSPVPSSECWRHSLFIVPCVQLTGGELCSEDPVFCATLEVCLEIFLLRPEPCAMHRHEPPCPELPLYPQPVVCSCHSPVQMGYPCCE